MTTTTKTTTDTFLVPAQTVTAKGDGPAVDLSGAASRVFLVTLAIMAATLLVGRRLPPGVLPWRD